MMRTLFSNTILLCLTLFLTAGCGGDGGPTLYPASGVVTYQGNPLAGAKVAFIPSGKGAIAMATTDVEGRFEIKTGALSGVVAGPAAVTVTMMESNKTGLDPAMTPEQMQEMAMAGTLQTKLDKQNTSLIPERYGKAESSGLSVDVQSSQEEYNLDLK